MMAIAFDGLGKGTRGSVVVGATPTLSLSLSLSTWDPMVGSTVRIFEDREIYKCSVLE